ncbi:MAG: hypothetical protein ABH836_03610 [Candidatus Omnitrophota bacterium]
MIKNQKGIVLIVSFIVIVSLILLGGIFLIIAVSEKSMANKDYYKKQAFWLAEAGIERTIKESPFITPTLLSVGIVWQEDFDVIKPTWDEITASWNDIAGSTAVLTENNPSADNGRVESESITLNVDTYPKLSVTSTAVDLGCSYTVQIDDTDVITNITEPGTDTVNIANAMGWSGVKTFKIGIQITGESKSAAFDLIKIESDGPSPSASPGDDQTTISWTTAVDSNSVIDVVLKETVKETLLNVEEIEYGSDTDYGFTVSNIELVKDHSVELSNLEDNPPYLEENTPYYFRVSSTDSLGNTVTSADYILSVIKKKLLGNGNYKTSTMSVLDFNNRWTTVSSGEVGDVDKKIQVAWKQLGSAINYAILTEGVLDIKGNASIDTDEDGTPNEEGEDYLENVTLSFQDTFGISKAEMKSRATINYTDPANNQVPVSGITWVDFDSGTEFEITTTGWSGSGILVVDGDLKITSGTFNGVIWVIGTLKISGNPTIKGALLVESGTEVDTTVTGTADITYAPNEINDLFSYLRETLSWKEF